MGHGLHPAGLMLLGLLAVTTAASAGTGRVTGLGGVFVRSHDPKALAA